MAENKKGQIIGYICFWVVLDEAHLANLAVAPEARRQGVAAFLLKTMIRYLRARGVKQILLEVRERNKAALSLYHKFGFKIDGRRKGYYSDTKEDAILMSLSL